MVAVVDNWYIKIFYFLELLWYGIMSSRQKCRLFNHFMIFNLSFKQHLCYCFVINWTFLLNIYQSVNQSYILQNLTYSEIDMTINLKIQLSYTICLCWKHEEYLFEYIERTWPRSFQLGTIVIYLANSHGRTDNWTSFMYAVQFVKIDAWFWHYQQPTYLWNTCNNAN